MATPDITNPSPLLKRLLSRCEIQPNNCWLFAGFNDCYGWGIIRISDHNERVHIVAFAEQKGEPPCGYQPAPCQLDRSCCNPDHFSIEKTDATVRLELQAEAERTMDTTKYRAISLSQGQVSIVDAEDYEALNQHIWFAWWNTNTKSFYAVRHTPYSKKLGTKQSTLQMSRVIKNVTGKGKVDHENHLTLDNRKENLRAASSSQNQWNRGRSKNNTSGYKGVFRNKLNGLWIARIRIHRKVILLGGSFISPQTAHAAYCEAAERLHGEFANTGEK